jgi:1-acyl-sn-glycerol-3-phosphate acyltransferase
VTGLDVARTLRLFAIDMGGMLARMAVGDARTLPSSAKENGLAEISVTCARALERAGIRLEVIGRDRVPLHGGFVFMWNQESHLDHLVLPVAIPRPFFSIYNNAIARFPIYGRHMKRSGHVHVDRTDESQWRASVARAAERVSSGECVLVSPEGTRSRGGELLPMKRGAFILAEQSRRPIVCVTVVGGHERLPRGSAIVRAGSMRVVLSEPMEEPDKDLVAHTFETTKRAYAPNRSGPS